MTRYRLLIAYDGTHYCGWQRQLNGISIQEKIEHTLHTILRTPISVHGSGRTDAGVHAMGQVAHFDGADRINTGQLLISLNALLPPDIRILSVETASPAFHARYHATSKVYHYHLHLSRIADPFLHAYHYRVPHPVDLVLLDKARHHFIGVHDFTSFSHEAHAGSAARNPVRHLYRLDCHVNGDHVRLEFEGNGFLYKMVRNIVGTLLDVSYQKILIDAIPAIFAAKDRTQAGTTAPPHGLFLMNVNY